MKNAFFTFARWIGYAWFVLAMGFMVWMHPLLWGGGFLALFVVIGALTAIYDTEHWRGIYYEKRHTKLFDTVGKAVVPHEARLADEMVAAVYWDGRDDYIWADWAPIREHFIDTVLLPSLPPAERSLIVNARPPMRDLVAGVVDSHIWARAQASGHLLGP
ncbi:MAG: hypothetical protein JSS20_16225 [Proteobacteria bacterium]|nr:hypothetical protein [Pseudomonadota bacterium]